MGALGTELTVPLGREVRLWLWLVLLLRWIDFSALLRLALRLCVGWSVSGMLRAWLRLGAGLAEEDCSQAVGELVVVVVVGCLSAIAQALRQLRTDRRRPEEDLEGHTLEKKTAVLANLAPQ